MQKPQLLDLGEIKIDTDLSVDSRLISFANQNNNPYNFMVGDMQVEIEYGDGKSLSDSIVYILNAG